MNNKISFIKQKGQRGQVIIVIILILLIVSLIILAVSSRSITDVKISQTSEESARAFSAAEAGVEDAVEQIRSDSAVLNNQTPIVLPGNPNAGTFVISAQGGTNQSYLSSVPFTSDLQTLQVMLADQSDPNLLTGNYRGQNICLLWGNTTASEKPAIEATVIYKNTSGQIVNKRFAIDPDSSRRPSDHFTADNPAECASKMNSVAADNNLNVDRQFQYAHKLNLTDAELPGVATCGAARCIQLLRLRLLWNRTEAQYLGVAPQGGFTLPSQGYKISSTGNIGETRRRVDVFEAYPSLPSIFDFALFNGSSSQITK